MLLPRARSGKKQKITVITLARQLGLSGSLFFITPILTKNELKHFKDWHQWLNAKQQTPKFGERSGVRTHASEESAT